MTDNKAKEQALIKNTGILAIGTLCAKAVSFFLLPLYTTVLKTEDYGTVDVLQSVSAFAMPFITMMLFSGIFRFIIDEKSELGHKRIITTAVLTEFVSIIGFCVITALINLFLPIEYCGCFIFYFSSLALLDICQNIARGFGRNKLYSLMNFLLTLISLLANLVMILCLDMRGESILIASGLAYTGASMVAVFGMKLWRYVDIKSFSRAELKELLHYCAPLIPNAVSWWIANTSDRLLIRFFLGAGDNGIYAAANKIPTIFTTVFNVFNVAWSESMSRNMGQDNAEEFANEMFEKMLRFFGCLCLGIICAMSLAFDLVIGPDYSDAYYHVYILVAAILLNAVCSLLGGIFTAYKRSDIIGKTTVAGALVNLLVNFVSIQFIGLYGASISTLVSYAVIAVVRTVYAKRLMSLVLPNKYILQFIAALALTTLCYFLRSAVFGAVVLAVVAVWSVIVNKALAASVIDTIRTAVKGKKE